MSKIYLLDEKNKEIRDNHLNALKKRLMEKTNSIDVLSDDNMLSLNSRVIFNKRSFDVLLIKMREMWRKSSTKESFENVWNDITGHVSIIGEKYILNTVGLNLPLDDYSEAYNIFARNTVIDEYVRFEKVVETFNDLIENFIRNKKSSKEAIIILTCALSEAVEEMNKVYNISSERIMEEIKKQINQRQSKITVISKYGRIE